MTHFERLVQYYGSQTAMAKALGVTVGAVCQWGTAGAIPPARAIMVEKLTNGQFKAVDMVKGDGNE